MRKHRRHFLVEKSLYNFRIHLLNYNTLFLFFFFKTSVGSHLRASSATNPFSIFPLPPVYRYLMGVGLEKFLKMSVSANRHLRCHIQPLLNIFQKINQMSVLQRGSKSSFSVVDISFALSIAGKKAASPASYSLALLHPSLSIQWSLTPPLNILLLETLVASSVLAFPLSSTTQFPLPPFVCKCFFIIYN